MLFNKIVYMKEFKQMEFTGDFKAKKLQITKDNGNSWETILTVNTLSSSIVKLTHMAKLKLRFLKIIWFFKRDNYNLLINA